MNYLYVISCLTFLVFSSSPFHKWERSKAGAISSAKDPIQWSYPESHRFFGWGKAPIWTVRTQSLEEREIYALIPEINYAEEDSTIPLDGVPIFSTLHEVLVFMWFKVPQCVVIFSDAPFPSNASEMPILVLDERLKKKVPRRIFFTSPMSLLDLIFISEL